MSNPRSDPYILNLEQEKRELQERMDELRRNIVTIDSLIIKRRSQLLAGTEGKKITRKNAERLFFESLILDIISMSKEGMRTADINSEIKKRGHRVNYNTLRAYIVSMRDTKRIRKNPKSIYKWIVDSDEASEASGH